MPTANDFTWQGIKNNLAENINLGLDLKGGTHLVMRVKTDEYLKTLIESNAQAVQTAVQDAKLPVGQVTHTAGNGTYAITLTVTDPAQLDAAVEEVKKKVDFVNWEEDKSGNSVTWTLPATTQAVLKNQAVDQALRIIESRINEFGVKEPTLARHGAETSGQILLQMPGVDDPERVKRLINAETQLSLMKVAEPYQEFPTREAALQSLGGKETQTRRVYPLMDRASTAGANQNQQGPRAYIILEYPPVIDGSELRDASAFSQSGFDNDFQIDFTLKPGGAQKFGEFTGRNIGKNLAIVLNNEVKSAPTIQGQIFDRGQITGNFTKQEAEDLALTLRSGSLPAKIEYLEERTVGPSLGADSIRAGVRASVGGFVFVILFMLFYYRGAGINAVIALVLNMLLTMAALIMLDSTLTLPGIAGLILGIGMAVDSNVLIFERMREELRAGQSIAKAVEIGFDRAFITIIDTHVTTIIAAIILYMYGSGPIRGFAVTLTLGLLINLFSAVFVSRTIFLWLMERNPNLKKLSI